MTIFRFADRYTTEELAQLDALDAVLKQQATEQKRLD